MVGIGPILQKEAENTISIDSEGILGAEFDKTSALHTHFALGEAFPFALQIVIIGLYFSFHFLLTHHQEHLLTPWPCTWSSASLVSRPVTGFH